MGIGKAEESGRVGGEKGLAMLDNIVLLCAASAESGHRSFRQGLEQRPERCQRRVMSCASNR